MDPWMVEILAYGAPVLMLPPAIIAAIIAGGSSIIGGYLSKSGQKEPSLIEDEYKDPLKALLSKYFQSRVGESRPGYEGDLSADYNPTLLAAIEQMTKQSQGFNPQIEQLVSKFSSPAGAQGWNPVSAGWNRRPGDTTSTGGVSPQIAEFVKSRMGG
jgi:hypothetical protein